MFKQYKFLLVLSLPLLLKYIFLLIYVDLDLIEKGEYIEDLLFYFSIISIFYTNILKSNFLIGLLYFLYSFYFVLETSSYIAVSSNFSSSFMYLLIESDQGELREFASSYISIPILLNIVFILILFFILFRNRLKIYNSKRIYIGSLVFIAIIAVLKFTGLIENNAYHNVVRGTYGYFQLQRSVKFNKEISKDDIDVKANNEVLVVVLGESTTSNNMQIYGYDRETTPLLNTMSDSLYIYHNVISSDVFTLKSVPKMLTSLDNTSKTEATANLVELFNSAGYSTFWLSNQRPISYHDNAISKIASASFQFKFYNHLIDKTTNVLDEIIFPEYKNILSRPGKKVIFIRLIGTHFDYNKRYPATFKKFLSNQNSTEKEKLINAYDNAILYNDFIVYSLIKDLQKENGKTALLYLSDHGENIYDNTDFFGRSETILRKSMFEIPFILWTSRDFDLPNDFEYIPNRSFMADHTYDSIGHLFGILYNDMNVSQSIFSNTFQERKRLVVNNVDFDSYFLNSHE